MHKKPIYGGKIILITEAADITSGDFPNKVFGPLRVRCGAAQNMDLFLHTHPLIVNFMQLESYLRKGQWKANCLHALQGK
jgi:hypothetical protein